MKHPLSFFFLSLSSHWSSIFLYRYEMALKITPWLFTCGDWRLMSAGLGNVCIRLLTYQARSFRPHMRQQCDAWLHKAYTYPAHGNSTYLKFLCELSYHWLDNCKNIRTLAMKAVFSCASLSSGALATEFPKFMLIERVTYSGMATFNNYVSQGK